MGRAELGKTWRTGSKRVEGRYSDRITEYKCNPRPLGKTKQYMAKRRGNRFKRGYECPSVGSIFTGQTVIGPERYVGTERRVLCRCVCGVEKTIRVDKLWLGKINSALAALNLLMPENLSLTETAIYLMTHVLENVGRLVTTTSKKDAKGRMTKTLNGMAVEAFDAPSNLLETFWNTLLHLTGLTSGGYHSTELIMTGITNLEIYELCLLKLTLKTKETYDLLNVGIKNQFQAGDALVHNCGFGMGVNKFQSTAFEMYRLKLTEEESRRAVNSYREANSAVPVFWKSLERAAITAIEEGVVVTINMCKFFCKDGFLWIELPSGRRLAYRDPQISWRQSEWGPQKTIEFYAVNSKTKKWSLERCWGGVLVENVVQATARDLMVEAILRLEAKGYRLLLTVHDEIICEARKGFGTIEEFTKIMCEMPKWAFGLPTEAKGYTASRYRK